MNKALIFIGPVNKAIRAKRVLKSNGIEASVERESEIAGKNGCGYSIIVVQSDKDTAMRILKKYGIAGEAK